MTFDNMKGNEVQVLDGFSHRDVCKMVAFNYWVLIADDYHENCENNRQIIRCVTKLVNHAQTANTSSVSDKTNNYCTGCDLTPRKKALRIHCGLLSF